METVLGLSLTPTAVGWVLVEGRDAGGTIVDHDQFEVRTGGGARAASTSAQVAAAVLQAQSAAAERDQHLHLVGVTWSDAAAAEAALLLESFTEFGLSNVVPIRSLDAAELLAGGIAPVVGYDRAAVCVLERDSATVVMVDDADGDARTAVKQLHGGADRLTQWLTTMYDRSKWRPDGVVVVADDDLDALSGHLEETLPVPVFSQSGVPLAMARGAALAAAQSTEFTGEPIARAAHSARTPMLRGAPSYTGALAMLAAGAVTLVASVSLAVGPRLVPDKPARPAHHVVHEGAPAAVAKAPAPPPVRIEPPPAEAPPAEAAPAEEPTVAVAPVEPQSVAAPEPSPDLLPAAEPVPPPPPPEPNPHPLLTKLLNRLHGVPDDPPPGEPPAP